MATREAVVGARVGLHARPASVFVQAVAASGADVTLRYGDKTANAASILGVLTLGVPMGARVVLESDDDRALGQLVTLIETDLEQK